MANLLGYFGQHAHGEFEDSLAVHAQEGVAGDLTAADLSGYVQNAVLAAIGMHGRGQDSRLVRGFEYHCAGAIAEQHAGATVAPVEDA
jgi:hypothetical protein